MKQSDPSAVPCPLCNGSGACPECTGIGLLTCVFCDGIGCPNCDAGTVACVPCNRSGRCWRCDGTGEVTTPATFRT